MSSKLMADKSKHCPCTSTGCPNHPTNHDLGCGPCISKNLTHGEIPSCFFIDVDGNEERSAYKYMDFAEAVMAKEEHGRKA